MIQPFASLARALQVLLILNLAIFILCFVGRFIDLPLVNLLSFSMPDLLHGQIWRLVSYMFTHIDPIHFIFNMLMLWMFGAEVAEIMGNRRFTWFYLGSGIFAMLASMYFHPFVLGASGALYAVMFAYAHYYPERQILLFFIFPMPMKYAIYVFAALDLLLVSGSNSATVAHLTHIGGFVAAYLYFKLIDPRLPTPPSPMERWMEQLRKTQPLGRVRTVDFTRDSVENPVNAEPVEHLVAEDQLDEILAKVSKEGLASLSEAEKDLLLEASRTRQIRSGKVKDPLN